VSVPYDALGGPAYMIVELQSRTGKQARTAKLPVKIWKE
jgi:hypothetical protein